MKTKGTNPKPMADEWATCIENLRKALELDAKEVCDDIHMSPNTYRKIKKRKMHA